MVQFAPIRAQVGVIGTLFGYTRFSQLLAVQCVPVLMLVYTTM